VCFSKSFQGVGVTGFVPHSPMCEDLLSSESVGHLPIIWEAPN